MKPTDATRPTGADLVQRYLNALTNLVTMERAKIIANNSEQDVLQQINSMGASNGIFTSGSDIPDSNGNQLVKDSINSQLMRVQSVQIAQKTTSEVGFSEQETKKLFVGKKVVITKLRSDKGIFSAVMVDSSTGKYRLSPFTASRVKGTINDISFENNLLVIRPSFFARKLVPNRLFIDVQVLDLETMAPNIDISL